MLKQADDTSVLVDLAEDSEYKRCITNAQVFWHEHVDKQKIPFNFLTIDHKDPFCFDRENATK
jgi:hypothetical protein